MKCSWLKSTPAFIKGISVLNKIEDFKFEKFLNGIANKVRAQEKDIFSQEDCQKLGEVFSIDEENLILAIKAMVYLLKKSNKYVFMPSYLKDCLIEFGLQEEKTNMLMRYWSNQTKAVVEEMKSNRLNKDEDVVSISWKINAEVSSEYHKKCKIAKVYLTLTQENDESELELTHSELYPLYLQMEGIQNELDSLFSI